MWLHSHLFGPHPLCCSVKPRIGCDKPVGVSSVISFGLKSMLFQTPLSLLSFFLFSILPYLPTDPLARSTRRPHLTRRHTLVRRHAPHTQQLFFPEHRHLTLILTRRRDRREREVRWMTLSPLPPSSKDFWQRLFKREHESKHSRHFEQTRTSSLFLNFSKWGGGASFSFGMLLI